jgi:autocrine motility factor receptor
VLRVCFVGRVCVLEPKNASERALSWVMIKTVAVAALHGEKADTAELVAWALWGVATGMMRVFTSLARDRFERQSSSPSVTAREQARTGTLIVTLLALDALLARAAFLVVSDGLTLWLLIYDTLLVGTALLLLSLRFVAHVYEQAGGSGALERRRHGQFVAEMAFEVTSDLLALAYTCTLFWLHGLSFHLVDAILLLHVRALVLSLSARLSRFAGFLVVSRTLRKAFSDVPAAVLAAMDEVCAVCRDPLDTAKRLPCGHMFHSLCLQRWLEVKTACPTCRRHLGG